ncbi:MAG: DUF3859 domain-containing protein [Xanthobacteraceae bacterium]|nr:DUF3859 domain-containing protein [Xanthobacteraceae bacterium]
MKHILFGVCLAFSFAAVSPAAAQIRAAEQWYGLYTVEGVQIIEDPNAPGGKRRVGGKIREPAVNSSRIQHTPGSYFGFGYVLTGAPSSETITVRHVQLIPPPGLRDDAGNVHDRIQSTLSLNSGRDLFIGISMGNNTLAGTWTLQVWHEGRVLLERKFEVYR